MLLSNIHHQRLLHTSWTTINYKNRVYYLKHAFQEHEYLILVTDLRLVWFELGDYRRIQRNAQVPNIDIETEKEAAAVLVRVKELFLENLTRLEIEQEPNVLKLSCHAQHNKKITTISWVFNCDLLDQQKSQGETDQRTGPEVIFDHFILPSQTIVNYFLESMADDDDQIKSELKNDHKSVFSTTALDYMSHLINQSGDTTLPVAREVSAIPSSELTNVETSHIMTEEELEEKRKLDLQRLAQEEKLRNPNLNKKRRRF